MSRTINPLLLDKPPISYTQPRNFARSAASSDEASFSSQLAEASAPAQPQPVTEQPAKVDQASKVDYGRVDRSATEFENDEYEFTFDDFVDLINPLQHIPIVSSIYRELTGDEIEPVSLIAGDIAYGAIMGNVLFSAITSVVSAAFEENTGENPVTMLADAIFGSDGEDGTEEVMLASAESPASTSNEEREQVIKTVDTTEIKLPFGGVIDLPADSSYTPPKVTAAPVVPVEKAAVSSAGATEFSGKLQGSAAMARTMAKVAGTQSASDVAARAMPTALPGATSTEGPTLGSLMHQSAQSVSGGNNSLPPDLVRDMMLMALDKYKTADGLVPSEMPAAVAN